MLYALITARWISGVFARESDARAYLDEIPAALRSTHTLKQLDEQQYPVYLIENSTGFHFMNAEAVLAAVAAHASAANEDHCCLTLYRIDRDYRPQVAGEDEMGGLRHEHVDNQTLARIRREGRAALRIMNS